MPEDRRELPTRRVLPVPLLSTLAPDGFFYGGSYVVEFDPDSLWYETSLSIGALALKQGAKVEYHVFQHFPDEAAEALSRLGVDVSRLEQSGLLNVIDSYTQTMEYEKEQNNHSGSFRVAKTRGKPLDLTKSAEKWAAEAKAGYTDKNKLWLHIDDNTGIFLRYNDERTMIDKWRTGILPYSIRARETPHLLAFSKGVASEEFYSQFEALCDGIIDLRAREEGGGIENSIRIRVLRGKKFDSRWHRLEVTGNGEVALAGVQSAESRRLAAIMFTDLVGFTTMTQKDESRAMDLLKAHRDILRPIILRHGGSEVKTIGDGMLIEFSSALAATECAIEIETRLVQYSKEKATNVQVRIGIHVGDVIHESGDVYGDAVNIASRIEPLARGGGTCITQQVYDQVRNKVPFRFSKIEAHDLKNVSASMDVYRLELSGHSTSGPVN